MMLSTVFSVSGSNGTDILLDSSYYKTSKITSRFSPEPTHKEN